MWKKECFTKNKFTESLMYAEEWELYSRILSEGINGISINKSLFFGRKHPNSNTGEFYSNNPIRKTSNSDAILLVVSNLKSKKLLNYTITRYFVQISLDYKEYHLFHKIIQIVNPSLFVKVKWQSIYLFLPFRLYLYRIKKKITR
jgi:hypothetical protein